MYRKLHAIVHLAARQRYRALRRSEVGSVAQQIVKHLPDPHFVTVEGARRRLRLKLQRDVMLGETIRDQSSGSVDSLPYWHFRHIKLHEAGINGGKVQNIVNRFR